MRILNVTEQNRGEIIDLLKSQKLPVEDLPVVLTDFYAAFESNELVGVIGIERYSQHGLLRSMVVHPDYRNKGIAEALVSHLEQQARVSGITEMYLLTETADKYFARKGYTAINRNAVPDELKASSEFSHVCPVSAVVMKKQLSNEIEPVSSKTFKLIK